jgi:predicted ArsR family transcriptional regulator
MRILNHLNYQAHWEAHIENPRIILDHCPYHTLQAGHVELCQMDSYLLEILLDAPITQMERLVNTPKGIPQCVFSMASAVH